MGEYQYSLDKKGRVSIPARFREVLIEMDEEGLVITRGLDNCLFVYSLSEWRNLAQKVKNLSMMKRDARSFSRLLFSQAAECSLDKQGRISIPLNLRKFAGLNKKVIIIGVLNRIEIWGKEKWDDYFQKSGKSLEEVAEKLVDLGI